MTCAVKIPGMRSLYFLMDLPDDREDLDDIEEGAWIEIHRTLYFWREGADRPEVFLCRSRDDPRHCTLFQRDEIDATEWEETGLNFGGTFSRESWREFAERLRTIRAFQTIPDDRDGEDT